MLHKVAFCLFVRGDQRLHLTPQQGLHASLIQIGRPLLRLPFQGGGEHLLDFLPTFQRHRASFFIIFISRHFSPSSGRGPLASPATEMPRTIEVSSMESLTKNRGPISRLCCKSS